MISDLDFLERIYGTPSNVADLLGISERHYRRIKSAGHATTTIEHLIERLIREAQEQIKQIRNQQHAEA